MGKNSGLFRNFALNSCDLCDPDFEDEVNEYTMQTREICPAQRYPPVCYAIVL